MGSPRLYGPNVLHNGDFELGSVSSWYSYNHPSSASAALAVNTVSPYGGNYDALFTVSTAGVFSPDVYLAQQPLGFKTAESYAMRFASKVSSARSIRTALFDFNTNMSSKNVSLSETYALYEHTHVSVSDTSSGRFMFLCGSGTPFNVYFDAIELRGYIDVVPSYAYERAEELERHDIRTRGGALYTYIETGGFTRFTLPLSWVGSLSRSIINSWWKSGTTLLYAEDSDSPFSTYNVRIVGVEEPFQSYTRPYAQVYYEGELVLETV